MTISLINLMHILPFGAYTRRSAAIMMFTLGLLASLAGPAVSQPTSLNQASAIVTAWLKHDPQPLGARLGKSAGNVIPYSAASSRIDYYVVNLVPSGFVIVPADDLVEPIIAFAPMGHYNPMTPNPLSSLVSSDIRARISLARKYAIAGQSSTHNVLGSTAGTKEQRKWHTLLNEATLPRSQGLNPLSITALSDPRIDPFIYSQWGQTTVDDTETGPLCYNYYTPNNYYAGCVATAMAQLMRYYQYPTAGVGTQLCPIMIDGVSALEPLLGGDGQGAPYQWSNMPLVVGTDVSLEQRQQIGRLCHDAGVASQMNYTGDGSGTRMLYASTALKYGFFYSNAKCAADTIWLAANDLLYRMINPNLQAGYPVLLGIFREDNNNLIGHAVVCDGYGYDNSTMYHHLNMGWVGVDNVWYNLPDINATRHQYTGISDCLYNVYPTGSGEIICGRVTDSTGQPVSGASVAANSYAAATNTRGLYAIAKVPPRTTYLMKVSAPGYVFPTQSVTTGRSADVGLSCGNLRDIDFVGQPDLLVGEVKKSPDGVTVACGGLVVSAVFGDDFYAQETGRSSGIRVHKIGHGLMPGKLVDIIGVMSTDDQKERFIEASTLISANGSQPKPLGFTNKLLGGFDWFCAPGSTAGQKGVPNPHGINNIGLLVRTTGIATYVDPSGQFAYIDDGSRLIDGNDLGPSGSPVIGVRLIIPIGVTAPSLSTRVTVTGISSLCMPASTPQRAIKIREQDDIKD